MDWFRSGNKTKLHAINKRNRNFSIYRKLFWTRTQDANSHTTHYNNRKRHKHNQHFLKLITLSLTLGTASPSFATDVGGVSATANPIANSSGSVTNQAIQVLQGPYITNTYGGGIQCQGATMNITPYANGNVTYKKPFEAMFMDPVYNNVDADDDGIPDNPGEILYEIPRRTNQKDNYTLSLGLSATWSKPLDKELQAQCKEAAAANIAYMQQNTANKRLDFEIARLKNCGELKKAGIMFHPKSPYYSVCADVVISTPPGTIVPHSHEITPKTSSSTSKGANPSSSDTQSSESQLKSISSLLNQVSPLSNQSTSSPVASRLSGANQLKVLQVGQM